MLVSFNERGREAGIPAYAEGTTGPILQDSEANPLWEAFHARVNMVLLVDRRGLVAYSHASLPVPDGEATLRAEVAALVAEGDRP